MKPLHRLILFLGCLSLGACGPTLPRYPAMPVDQTLEAIAARAEKMQSVSAAGRLILIDAQGRRVSLEAALVAAKPDRLRVRAWKFNQAVFDMTRVGKDIWLWQGRQMKSDRASSLDVTADRLNDVWAFVAGGLVRGEVLQATDADPMTATYALEESSAARVLATIDRKTLVATSYTLEDGSGRTRLSVALSKYRMIDGLPWPMRMQVVSDQGQVRVDLSEVVLNQTPPANAFNPPARAKRLP